MSVTLSNREAEIMAVLWEQGPSTVTEVKDKLSDQLAYTTVLTILRNLEAKEYVGHEADGRAHRYFPRDRAAGGTQERDPALGGKLFQGSADLLLTQLVADRKLSEDQVRRIREILDEKPARRNHDCRVAGLCARRRAARQRRRVDRRADRDACGVCSAAGSGSRRCY